MKRLFILLIFVLIFVSAWSQAAKNTPPPLVISGIRWFESEPNYKYRHMYADTWAWGSGRHLNDSAFNWFIYSSEEGLVRISLDCVLSEEEKQAILRVHYDIYNVSAKPGLIPETILTLDNDWVIKKSLVKDYRLNKERATKCYLKKIRKLGLFKNLEIKGYL